MVVFGDLHGGLFEDGDECLADSFALGFGVVDAGEFFQELVAGLGDSQVHVHVLLECLDDLLGFAEAHQSVVDVDAGQLVADGSMDQCGGDGGIDAARESADHVVVANLLADLRDCLSDEVGGVPVAGALTDLVDEVAQEVQSVGRVDDLGMKLDAITSLGVAHGSDGDAVGSGQLAKAVGHLVDSVSVGHPDGHRSGQVLEQRRLVTRVDVRRAELALATAFDASAELVGHGLHAVADSEHGHAAVEGPIGGDRGAIVVDAGRSAAENDASRIEFANSLPGGVGRDEFAVDVEFSHPSRNEHGGLRTEVDDDDRFVLGLEGFHVIMICAQ